jgi:type II secretory pathway component PulM
MKRFWLSLQARERASVLAAALVLLLGVVWITLVAPARKTLRDTPAQIATLDASLASMRLQAQQLQTLRQAPRRAPPADFLQTVTTKARAALGSSGKVTAGPAEVRASIDAIAPALALALLQDVADNAQARADELSLTANGNGTVKLSVKWVAR